MWQASVIESFFVLKTAFISEAVRLLFPLFQTVPKILSNNEFYLRVPYLGLFRDVSAL
jgi:hypothetical protein